MADIGSLVFSKDITKDDIQFLVNIIAREPSNETVKILESIVDDPSLMLEILDLLAGYRIKFPDRNYIEKTVTYIRIYSYVKSRGFSEESYRAVAKQFDKRPLQCKKIVERFDAMYKDLMKEDLSK